MRKVKRYDVENGKLKRKKDGPFVNYYDYMILERALKEICALGANPITEYGYGKEIPWPRFADKVWEISLGALRRE